MADTAACLNPESFWCQQNIIFCLFSSERDPSSLHAWCSRLQDCRVAVQLIPVVWLIWPCCMSWCHCGQCWSRFSPIIWAGMQMSGCGHLLIVFYKHMPVVQARRHYILTAALWLAVLLDIQRQTVNIVLLVFVVVLFLRCDSLLRWLKNWWPNSLPCSSNVNILLINDIKALICLNL